MVHKARKAFPAQWVKQVRKALKVMLAQWGPPVVRQDQPVNPAQQVRLAQQVPPVAHPVHKVYQGHRV